MCFSPAASFLAAGGLGAAGAATLKRLRKRRHLAAFASIPLLFGVQQAIEGVVWITFGRTFFHVIATYAFLLIAQVFWPIFLPYAVLLMERDPRRKRLLFAAFVAGSAVGVYLLVGIMQGPVLVSIAGNSLDYDVPVPYPLMTFAAYVLATCAACLCSSHRYVKIFGAALCASLIIAYLAYQQALFSVWCFFAAILSLIVFVHMARRET